MDYLDYERFAHENRKEDNDKIYLVVADGETVFSSGDENETDDAFIRQCQDGEAEKVETGWVYDGDDYKNIYVTEIYKNE